VQVVLLDTTAFRTAATLLGEEQWTWLDGQLRERAQVRLLVSPEPVRGWPAAERLRLQRLIRATAAGGLVVLSGDGEAGLASGRRGSPSPPELTAGALSGPEARFGLVEIDWTRRRLALSLRGVDGRPRRQASLRLDDLWPAS
jgi:alkaline phosphatase D